MVLLYGYFDLLKVRELELCVSRPQNGGVFTATGPSPSFFVLEVSKLVSMEPAWRNLGVFKNVWEVGELIAHLLQMSCLTCLIERNDFATTDNVPGVNELFGQCIVFSFNLPEELSAWVICMLAQHVKHVFDEEAFVGRCKEKDSFRGLI